MPYSQQQRRCSAQHAAGLVCGFLLVRSLCCAAHAITAATATPHCSNMKVRCCELQENANIPTVMYELPDGQVRPPARLAALVVAVRACVVH